MPRAEPGMGGASGWGLRGATLSRARGTFKRRLPMPPTNRPRRAERCHKQADTGPRLCAEDGPVGHRGPRVAGEVVALGDVDRSAVEAAHVGFQAHRPAAPVDPLKARAPVKVGGAVVVEGLGVDPVLTGLVVEGDGRSAAAECPPRPERVIRHAGPHFAADGDIHAETSIRGAHHGRSPDHRAARASV